MSDTDRLSKMCRKYSYHDNNEDDEKSPYAYLDLPLLLVSPRFSFEMVWLPKCACSSFRQWFLDIHDDSSSYHDIHCNKKYRGTNGEMTNMQKGGEGDDRRLPRITCIRNPYYRVLSTFFQKHVFQKDRRYLSCFGMRLFRRWICFHNLDHCLFTYLLFIRIHNHGMDIHEEPQTSLLERYGCIYKKKSTNKATDNDDISAKKNRDGLYSVTKNTTILVLEDPLFNEKWCTWQKHHVLIHHPPPNHHPLDSSSSSPPNSTSQQKEEEKKLYEKGIYKPLPMMNATPKVSSTLPLSTLPLSYYSLLSIDMWRRNFVEEGRNVPSYDTILVEPYIKCLIEDIYEQDLLFWRSLFFKGVDTFT